jgi:hypothetical protein
MDFIVVLYIREFELVRDVCLYIEAIYLAMFKFLHIKKVINVSGDNPYSHMSRKKLSILNYLFFFIDDISSYPNKIDITRPFKSKKFNVSGKISSRFSRFYSCLKSHYLEDIILIGYETLRFIAYDFKDKCDGMFDISATRYHIKDVDSPVYTKYLSLSDIIINYYDMIHKMDGTSNVIRWSFVENICQLQPHQEIKDIQMRSNYDKNGLITHDEWCDRCDCNSARNYVCMYSVER